MPSRDSAASEGGLDAEDIYERLPEVTLIADPQVRAHTVDALRRGAPAYFWTAPATTSDAYHSPLSRHERGLWIHTKMVFSAYEAFYEAYTESGALTDEEVDYGRAAVLLHDMRKHGEDHYPGKTAASDHDLRAAAYVREETGLPDPVADAVETHMGPWYDGPAPERPLQKLVHQADMAGSASTGTFGLYEPAPELHEAFETYPEALRDRYGGSLPTVDL